MIVVVTRPDAGAGGVARLAEAIEAAGFQCARCNIGGREIVAVTTPSGAAPDRDVLVSVVADDPAVEYYTDASGRPPLASVDAGEAPGSVSVGGVALGGDGFVVVAGPCAVETPAQLLQTIDAVAELGAVVIRGGVFKPRTSPYSFQGLGAAGIELLTETRRRVGLPVVTEVVSVHDVSWLADAVDMLQVGARNAQNFDLLREVGRAGVPVLLKRGFGCTTDEWLHAAEYVLSAGNPNVVLCERGIRTFESSTRFTLDISAVPVVKQRSHLPVIVDPSHAAGSRYLVAPLALASAAVGADGVMIDVHRDPLAALCDGDQALTVSGFDDLMSRLRRVLRGIERPLATAPHAARRDSLAAPA